MVDGVRAFHAGPPPAIETCRHISANESVFAGHFPGLHLWPGTLTLEGMGQSGALMMSLLAMRRAVEAEGGDPETAFAALRNLERGYRIQPGYQPADAAMLLERMRSVHAALAIGASAEIKLIAPVFAGQRLDYHVTLSDDFGDKVRFDARASVDGAPVAAAVLIGARIALPVPPAR
jgi:3-hydroxyacyl-[acyl-carrier-protein] dehydratase